MNDRDSVGKFTKGHRDFGGRFQKGHAPTIFKDATKRHTLLCPCGTKFEYLIKTTQPRKYCSRKCLYKYRTSLKGVPRSIETRIKIGIANKEFYSKNPHRLHTWRGGVSKNPGYKTAMKKKSWLGTEGSHTKEEWEDLKKEYNFTCPSCHKVEPEIKLTQDHIISLSRGGTDYIDNIQPLCHSCNSSKNYRTIRYERTTASA